MRRPRLSRRSTSVQLPVRSSYCTFLHKNFVIFRRRDTGLPRNAFNSITHSEIFFNRLKAYFLLFRKFFLRFGAFFLLYEKADGCCRPLFIPRFPLSEIVLLLFFLYIIHTLSHQRAGSEFHQPHKKAIVRAVHGNRFSLFHFLIAESRRFHGVGVFQIFE